MAPPSRTSRRREKTRAPETPLMAWKLPMDLMLEIMARSNHRTLVRCAATCNLLRREILSPLFVRRFAVLAYLFTDVKQPLGLVHPTTPAALSLCYKHLPRFMSASCKLGALFDKFAPVPCRGSHVLLRRRCQSIEKRPKSDRHLDLCVYDPMSGAQTFFSAETQRDRRFCDPKYILLTAADGIGKPFLLLAFDHSHHGQGHYVYTASSRGKWEFADFLRNDDFPLGSLEKLGEPTVLSGGVMHWLPRHGKKIGSYDFGGKGTKAGWVELPPINGVVKHDGNNLYLATSSDKKLLKLLAIRGSVMFVWLQLPGGNGWVSEAVINMEEQLRSLDPSIIVGPDRRIVFEGSGKRTGEVVFLREVRTQGNTSKDYGDVIIVFDLETNKMQRKRRGVSLLEIDLPARLQAMKTFT